MVVTGGGTVPPTGAAGVSGDTTVAVCVLKADAAATPPAGLATFGLSTLAATLEGLLLDLFLLASHLLGDHLWIDARLPRRGALPHVAYHALEGLSVVVIGAH